MSLAEPAAIGRRPKRYNRMHPIVWVPREATSLLDVGCNVGALLSLCRETIPGVRLAGVEINAPALDEARRRLPEAELHGVGAEALPFAEGRFDCVTCIEVLEHIPAELRRQSLAEMRRVLRPSGRLLLRVPHAGLFAWLDPNNLRFRFPRLYGRLVRRGLRDSGYAAGSEGVVWHHHFTSRELLELLGDGWEVEAIRRGGLLLAPLTDLASWPFYRARRTDHAVFRTLAGLGEWDLGCPYGPAAYDILVVARKV